MHKYIPETKMNRIIAFIHESEEPLAGLNWDDVRLFLALCRARTVGEAARRLAVDASTVSRRLVGLEETLAARLFDRGRSGLAATEAVRELMPIAEQIEASVARFAGAAEEFEREVAGTVRISCPPDAAEVVLAPHLRELLRLHPALKIDLEAGEGVVDLIRREADLALRTARPKRGDLVVTRLFVVRWVLAAALPVAQELGPLRAWADAPWIGPAEGLVATAPARWQAKHVPVDAAAIRADSFRTQISLVAAGAGVALIPERSLAHYGLAPVKLARKLRADAQSWPVDELYLVAHRGLRNVPRVRVVWEFLLESIGGRTG
jgi:DNA-binding transcriptional LysR family regulator